MTVILMNGEGWPGIQAGYSTLRAGSTPLDAIQAAIEPCEINPAVRTVGFGGAPNAEGILQLDASAMNGDTLETGAVGALEATPYAFRVARKVMEKLPHVMLVGAGARLFAKEYGFSEEQSLSSEAATNYKIWLESHPRKKILDLFAPTKGEGCHGTVICLVRNSNGSFAGGVSTSGWDYKYPGRLGDSPIIGAGLYVDSRYGAAACTHCGENAIRSCLAHSVVLYMKKGASVKEAVLEGMNDLAALRGGYQGQVVVYAIDKNGQHFVARRFSAETDPYLLYTDGMSSHLSEQPHFSAT